MRRLAVLSAFLALTALTAPVALAQTETVVADPRELTEAGRKAYAEQLRAARALVNEKKFDEAIVILDKLTAERPREPQARFQKGLALADSGKTDDAIAVFRGLLNEYPELPEPHNNLAVLYAQKGEYDLARVELETAIAAAPDYVVAYENLGDVHAQLAARNYERAVARDARNKTAPTKLKLVREALVSPAATTPPIVTPPPAK